MRQFHWLIVVVITVFPGVLFVAPRGSNASFYLLLLFALLGIASRCKPMGKSFTATCREYWLISLAMTGLLCAVIIHQLATGQFSAKAYDQPSRLACFVLLFWILLLVPTPHLKSIQWGLIIGSVVCTAVLYLETKAGAGRPERLFDVPLIPFGNIALLIGMLALFSIGWNDGAGKTGIALKLAAGALALFGCLLTQSRGGWIAVPAFVLIAFTFFGEWRPRRKLLYAAMTVAALATACTFSNVVHNRIHQGEADLRAYLEGRELDSSVGHRILLWRGSWLLFTENPVFGTGLDRFPEALQHLAARHEITPKSTAQPHSHNELLFFMAALGVFGMLAILALYLVPAFYFFRERQHPDREVRTTAAMGLALTIGFLLFGLTDVMFYWTVSYTFYAIMLASLFAHLVKRKAIFPL